MFTIKNVNKDPLDPKRSSVTLWEGQNVSLAVNDKTKKPNVMFQMPDGAHCSIDHGVVFVMNGNGKTVDTFLLEGSEWY